MYICKHRRPRPARAWNEAAKRINIIKFETKRKTNQEKINTLLRAPHHHRRPRGAAHPARV